MIEYLVIVVLMTLSGIIYYTSGEKGLILYFALMCGMRGISVKRLFISGLITGLSGLAIRSFLAAFGCMEDVTYLQYRRFAGEVFRRAMGDPHPNTLSSSYTILAIMVLLLIGYSNKRKVWKASFLILIVACYIYVYSGSRTGLLILGGFVVLNLIYTYRQKTGLIERVVIILRNIGKHWCLTPLRR